MIKKWYVACLLVVTSLCDARCSQKCALDRIKSIVSNIQSQLSSSLCNSCIATPVTAPAIITESGTYCLTNNSTETITIAANNVALDLNNRQLGVVTGSGVTSLKVFNEFVKNGSGINFTNSSNIQLSLIEVDSSPTSGISLTTSETIFIEKVIVKNSANHGIRIDNCQNILIDTAVINSSTLRGIVVTSAGAAEVFLTNCAVYNSGNDGFALGGPLGSNIKVHNCIAFQNAADGFEFGGSGAMTARDCESLNNQAAGFRTGGSGSNITFINDVAENNASHGFFVTNGARAVLQECIAFGNGSDGFNFDFNNSFGLARGCSASYNTGYGFNDQTGPTSPVIYVNNMASNNTIANYSQATTIAPFYSLLYTNAAANYWTNVAAPLLP